MDKSFKEDLLSQELIDYNPKRWRIHLPFVHYPIRLIDWIPALSGAIGKIALIAAFAVAWSKGLNLSDPTFVSDNVRLEIVLGGIFAIIFSGIYNPYVAPAGTLAPLIPLIPVLTVSGVHPLPLSLLIVLLGIIPSLLQGFKKMMSLNGQGTTAGIMLLFGLMGIISSLENLNAWCTFQQSSHLSSVLILGGIFLYILLGRWRVKYLMIPLCALFALIASALFKVYPDFTTPMGLPIINPYVWWHEKWGLGFGLDLNHFIKAFPFALLTVVMWPIDALAIRKIQEASYPEVSHKTLFDVDDTYFIVALRQLVGGVIGGGQIASVWRSFMIPLATVKRPLAGSAFVLGILSVCFGVMGYPIDLAIFPPLLWLVLIVGVYIPLLEVGFSMMQDPKNIQTSIACILLGFTISPIIGWVAGVLIENFNLLHTDETNRTVSFQDKCLILSLVAVIIITYVYTNVIAV